MTRQSCMLTALGLEPKVIAALARANVTTIGALINHTPAELMAIPGLGPVAVHKIEVCLMMQGFARGSGAAGALLASLRPR
jgi:hypothetical protein